MAFQSVPGVAEAVIRYAQQGQTCTMTFYGWRSTGYNQTNIDALAQYVDEWAGEELRPQLATEVQYLGTVVRGLEDENDLFAENTDNLGFGAIASPSTTNALALAVKRQSAFTGRSARGRVYFPLVNAHLIADSNFVDPAEAANLVTVLNTMRDYMFDAVWTEVIVSRRANGAVRPTGVTFPVISYSVTDFEVDSQRRRMPGR